MDAADLKVFEAVARSGGMSRAASELNTVQSNVTARIRHLEQDLATSLFYRSNRGVSLTPAGRRLLPYAQRVARLLDEARRATHDDGTPRGPLVIGSLETTAAMRLSTFLSVYVARFPEVDVALKTGTSGELIDLVLSERIEGAFVCGPVHHPDLVEERMFREELVVLTAPGVASLTAALACPGVRIIVMRAGCSYRLSLEALLAHRGIVGIRHLEFASLESILACVGAGLGITMLPKALVERTLRDKPFAVHPLAPDERIVETMFVRRRDGFASSALEAFLNLARASGIVAAAAE
ncbi:MAG: LysR family transcriptional regulator [Rhodospirillales bacterium]|nr:LysR family transcriptional regulator [Rhodospirillales bacterium]